MADNVLQFVLAMPGANAPLRSPARAPGPGFAWVLTAFSAEAPGGTDGAILFRRSGVLTRVEEIGEFTSNDFPQPVTIGSTQDIAVEAQGVAAAGNLIVNITYTQGKEA